MARCDNAMKSRAFIEMVWEKWGIQGYVMASLGCQMILLSAGLMKRWARSGLVYMVIWCAYLLATFFATVGLSFINRKAAATDNNGDIFLFWAPFLLVHLGRPHTITALAMEDINLWRRQMLTCGVQVSTVVLVFYHYQIFKSQWVFPTLIVFAIGIFNCFERISSLHLAYHTLLRSSVVVTPQKKDKKGGGGGRGKKLGDFEKMEYRIVRKGHKYYEIFKWFVIDHTFISDECGRGKKFFSDKLLREEDAFKVMEVELYFVYLSMYTKMNLVQFWEKYLSIIWGVMSRAFTVAAAVMFFCHPKHNVHSGDVGVTYCLLGGLLVSDGVAGVHLLFSESTMAMMLEKNKNKKASQEEMSRKKKYLGIINGVRKFLTGDRYWSENTIQYSLINHSLRRWWKWAEGTLEFLLLKEFIESALLTQTVKVGPRLKKLVMDDIKRKEKHHPETPQRSDDETVVEKDIDYGDGENRGELLRFLDEIIYPLVVVEEHNLDYTTYVLILHVATEICYFTINDGGEEEEEEEEGEDSDSDSDSDNKELCKQISEYLAYLVALEVNITSVVPGSIGRRFKDICGEQVKHTLNDLDNTIKYRINRNKNIAGTLLSKRTSRRDACNYLMTEYCRDEKSGDKETEKSVLCTAVDLAKAFNNYYSKASSDPEDVEIQSSEAAGKNNSKDKKKKKKKKFWRNLSRVWVGLLMYASTHCRGDAYYLSRGGEFYTFVRLLMAHFGLQQRLRGQRIFHPNYEIH